MNIQETISVLQSKIKNQSRLISKWEDDAAYWLDFAKEGKSDSSVKYGWREYYSCKDQLNTLVKEQVALKSLYKLMCKIQKQMPNGSISMHEIRGL